MSCEICGNWMALERILAGDVPACLCAKHAREWADDCGKRPQFEALCVAAARWDAEKAALKGAAGPVDGVVEAAAKYRAAKARMCEVAREWLDEQLSQARAKAIADALAQAKLGPEERATLSQKGDT